MQTSNTTGTVRQSREHFVTRNSKKKKISARSKKECGFPHSIKLETGTKRKHQTLVPIHILGILLPHFGSTAANKKWQEMSPVWKRGGVSEGKLLKFRPFWVTTSSGKWTHTHAHTHSFRYHAFQSDDWHLLPLCISATPPLLSGRRKPAPIPSSVSQCRDLGSGSGDPTPVQSLHWVEKIPSSRLETCVLLCVQLHFFWQVERGDCQWLLLEKKHRSKIFFFKWIRENNVSVSHPYKLENPQLS